MIEIYGFRGLESRTRHLNLHQNPFFLSSRILWDARNYTAGIQNELAGGNAVGLFVS